MNKKIKLIDSGTRFGKLIVLEYIKKPGNPKACFRCICDCGNEVIVLGQNLRRGLTKSCGCTAPWFKRPRHHLTNTPEWHAWADAKSRCCTPGNTNYRNYGGRGIKMCAGWRESFPDFLFDIRKKQSGQSLDRINNDGHYSCGHCEECIGNAWPANCRWATHKEQRANQRPCDRRKKLKHFTDEEYLADAPRRGLKLVPI
jgi:hypothetical protein